jgi:hypothetical protein
MCPVNLIITLLDFIFFSRLDYNFFPMEPIGLFTCVLLMKIFIKEDIITETNMTKMRMKNRETSICIENIITYRNTYKFKLRIRQSIRISFYIKQDAMAMFDLL